MPSECCKLHVVSLWPRRDNLRDGFDYWSMLLVQLIEFPLSFVRLNTNEANDYQFAFQVWLPNLEFLVRAAKFLYTLAKFLAVTKLIYYSNSTFCRDVHAHFLFLWRRSHIKVAQIRRSSWEIRLLCNDLECDRLIVKNYCTQANTWNALVLHNLNTLQYSCSAVVHSLQPNPLFFRRTGRECLGSIYNVRVYDV